MICDWDEIRGTLQDAARTSQILPFLGAAVSIFRPTNLPRGDGLVHAALQGMFPDRGLFENHALSEDEEALHQHSAEVVLQGLAEGLLERDTLAVLYNAMRGAQPNPLHGALATALMRGRVPAVFTTNQDQCIEDAASQLSYPVEPVYDEDGFAKGLKQGLFQFHGAIGGSSRDEEDKRSRSLTFTLHSMGSRLPHAKHIVLQEALAKHILLFLGYSGADPDIWYSLSQLLSERPTAQVYWCVHGSPPQHLARLVERHPASVLVFRGDLRTVVRDLALSWGIANPGDIEDPDDSAAEAQLANLRRWASDFTDPERDLAFGWLLVSVGRYRHGAEILEALARREPASPVRVLAMLLGGYARREIGEHRTARAHLKKALEASEGVDPCRHAQAAHKLGESLSAFESVRFWYLWPTRPRLHAGAAWLVRAIQEYRALPPGELRTKQLGRAGLGNALMNLGQLYRRTARYVPLISRPRLMAMARQLLSSSLQELTKEGDLRSLPMALAAAAAEDPDEPVEGKKQKANEAIEYAEQWNKDNIQIGSAYFAKGQLLARDNRQEAEHCYHEALQAFRDAEMRAEEARAAQEIAALLSGDAYRSIGKTQCSWEWKLGLRVIGISKFVRQAWLGGRL